MSPDTIESPRLSPHDWVPVVIGSLESLSKKIQQENFDVKFTEQPDTYENFWKTEACGIFEKHAAYEKLEAYEIIEKSKTYEIVEKSTAYEIFGTICKVALFGILNFFWVSGLKIV